MTYEETIEWMNRYRAARRAEPGIKEQLREEKRRVEYAETIRRQCPGGPDDGISSAIQSINNRQKKLTADLISGEAARAEIETAIASVDDALEREVLQARYIEGRTNRQIAARMRITERYVRKLHRRAIFKVTKLVPLSSAPVC